MTNIESIHGEGSELAVWSQNRFHHAPVKGAPVKVSIHAPVKGAKQLGGGQGSVYVFQSTLP